MHVRISALPLAVAAAALLALAGPPASATHTPSHQEDGAAAQTQQLQEQLLLQQRRHVVNDGIADTPVEVDGLHHGAGPSDGGGHQHPGVGGHLPGSSENVELIGQVTIKGVTPGQIADVGTLGNFAYLGKFDDGTCEETVANGGEYVGGAYVVDISNPRHPKEVGFVPTANGSYTGEGVQALSIKTRHFRGDILVLNNEICGISGEQIGGFTIYDITNPLAPVELVQGAGDTDPGGIASTANQIHSAFAWQQGKKAYVVIVDDEELTDVDIFDISDPRNPVQIAETGLFDETGEPVWPDAQEPLALGDTTFFHDVVVKKVRGNWLMLLSYWDAGYIVLNVNDPSNPVFVGDTDFTDPDPETGQSPPEGNGHQAEFDRKGKLIISTDEDFSPERLLDPGFVTGTGDYPGGIFGFGKALSSPDNLPDATVNGPVVFGGYGCNDDTDDIPDPSVLTLGPGEERILVLQRGPVGDANHPGHDACFFSDKAANAAAAGYDAVLIANHHNGSGAGAAPDAALCGGGDDTDIFALCIGHRAMHELFGLAPNYTFPYPVPAPLEPVPGTLGVAKVSATAEFDGWGYVHLYDADTLEEIDTYAIPESLDPEFAEGFGDLSVHEVATDPKHDIGYISYYAGGFRVISFDKRRGIREIGHYIHEDGNNFWGVQIAELKHRGRHGFHRNRFPLVLASDRDSGLWIFRYTGGKEHVASAAP
jgi:hypothetical protein